MTSKTRLTQANTALQEKDRLTLARTGWTPETRLSEEEMQQLDGCEEIIENGLNIWYQVGEALLHIRDSRLYRAKYKTFEEYCQERWQMTRRYSNYLIQSSEVYANLGTIVPKEDMPAYESQVRPLTPLTPEEQKLVWDVVQQTAPRGKVTAAHVKSVVTVLKEVTQTGAIDDGTGVSIPVAEATTAHLKAAMTEEAYERMARQEIHIAEKQPRKASPQTLATEEYEWYTPPLYLEAARAVMGFIDLDPASSPQANLNVKATRFFTRSDDGLTRSWGGRVWLNPPYGANAAAFIERLLESYRKGHVTEAIALVNANSTDTKWFQPLWNHALCFTNHRIDFISPVGQPASSSTHGSVFVYLGTDRRPFLKHFSAFGAVVARIREYSNGQLA